MIADNEMISVPQVHKDEARETIAKKRRTFVFRERYFQLDIYLLPLPPSWSDTRGILTLILGFKPTQPERANKQLSTVVQKTIVYFPHLARVSCRSSSWA